MLLVHVAGSASAGAGVKSGASDVSDNGAREIDAVETPACGTMTVAKMPINAPVPAYSQVPGKMLFPIESRSGSAASSEEGNPTQTNTLSPATYKVFRLFYVATSRLHDNRHFLSDVVFGSALGTATGWTVVGRHGRSSYALTPVAVPGGFAFQITHANRNATN